MHISEAAYLGEIGTPKTDAGARAINIDPQVFPLLEEWRRKSKRTRPDDFIFGTRTGELENPNNILRRHVYPACDALEIRRASWLTFRRTYQTWLHGDGVPARTIADLVGHANVETQFIYVQDATDGEKQEAAKKIGEKLQLSRFCPDGSVQPPTAETEGTWVN